jgi:3-deoxy-7-phosphoheptulonate synthase
MSAVGVATAAPPGGLSLFFLEIPIPAPMSTALKHARERIDDIDRQFVRLLARRQQIVDEVAETKAETGRPARDASREEQLLDRVRSLADEAGLAPDLVARLYEHILAHFVQRQRRRLGRSDASTDETTGDETGSGARRSPGTLRLVEEWAGGSETANGTHNGPSAAVSEAAAASSVETETTTDAAAEAGWPPRFQTSAEQEASDVDVESKPYRLAARSQNPEGTVVSIRDGLAVGGDDPVLIAGPCSVESREQILRSAEAVARAGGDLLRGGCFKPRTSPHSFQGMGREGLDLLAEAGRTFDLPVITEVMEPDDVPLVADKADVLQVGARNMQNFPLLKALGETDAPVMLKRGMMAEIDEWLAAAEYILAHGNPNVFLCERGIRTFETATRNTLDVSAVPVLRERTHLPVVVDPAHACGNRRWVPSLVRAALAAGADGVMVEAHPNPDEALSDGPQSLPLDDVAPLARLFR